MKPIAWYDPTNGMVSTDKDSPLFTPLGQVLPLYPKQEQEPVAIPDCGEAGHADGACGNRECLPSFNRNTTPPQRKPLTDEEIETYRYMIDWTAHWSYINFARAIEAAHGIKEKNT